MFGRYKQQRIVSFTTLLLVSLLLTNTLFASTDYPRDDRIPGGIAIVALGVVSAKKPEVSFYGTKVFVRENPHKQHHWFAVIGLSLKLKPGRYKIDISKPKKTEQWFSINYHQYSKKIIPFKNKRLVTPDKITRRLILQEQEVLHKAFEKWTEVNKVPFHMLLPVKDEEIGKFGTYRFLNGHVLSMHQGIDIAAARGTPVFAAAAGKIALTGELFLEGNTVIINHGAGLFTQYSHLKSYRVKVGDPVTNKTVIGRSGATGRASNESVHWEVILNKARVQPRLFLNRKSKIVLDKGLIRALTIFKQEQKAQERNAKKDNKK